MNIKEPSRVLQAMPMARLVELRGQQLVVCKHTKEHVNLLSSLGIKAPPLELDWQYTGRFEPTKHQKKSVEYYINTPRGFDLSDMGTGKTAAASWAAEYLLQRGEVTKVLIVCPFSVMGVWEQELFNITPHRSVAVLHGTKDKRIELLNGKYTFNIINFDGVNTILDQVVQANFDLVIVDEASAYRNAGTARFRNFRDFVRKVKRFWAITATPTPNSPTDAWALIKLVNPSMFKGSFSAFRELTMKRVDQFRWIPRPEAKEIVYKLMSPAIRFRKEDCLDLPPITYTNRECELTAEQKKAFDEMRKLMVLSRDSQETITAANAAVKLIKLIQIACGVVKDNNNQVHHIKNNARLELLYECIEQAGEKVIVFVPFIAVLAQVEEFLKTKGLKVGVVSGATSLNERNKIFQDFERSDNIQILLAHPKTTAHGLTLIASTVTIWYAPIFSAEQYLQANARMYRKGQTKPCTVIHIGSTKLEWKLYEALWGKIEMQSAILKQYEELSATL